jgi:hypothetical protein
MDEPAVGGVDNRVGGLLGDVANRNFALYFV